MQTNGPHGCIQQQVIIFGPRRYNELVVLLIVATVQCFAIDTSICERGFSTMNLLKTARRSLMGAKLLRMSMVICMLGAEWKDPSIIPVEEIIDIWRSESKRGRYEGSIWQEHALQAEFTGSEGGTGNGNTGGTRGTRGGSGVAANNDKDGEVNAMNDNDYFAR